MSYTLGNKCAKNLCKRTILLQLFIENVATLFLENRVHACLCCVFEAQRFVGGKSVFVQFYPPVSFEAIARDLWDLVYEGWYPKTDVPGLSTVTRSYLSQTDRASAAHTIR